MEFDKSHKVKPESLTLEEAREFDKFLLKEIKRHDACRIDAWVRQGNSCIAEVWKSAEIRHTEDIQAIHQLRIKLRELFEL